MFSASPPQRPDPHHHLAASSHRGARQLRAHDPLRWVSGGGGKAAPPGPRPVNGRFAPPRSAASEALRGRSSHPSFPAFFLFPSVPLPCRPAPRMGGGVLGGGRQLLHRVSNCPAPRGALAARPWPGRGAASGGWGGAGPLPPPTGPDPARPAV